MQAYQHRKCFPKYTAEADISGECWQKVTNWFWSVSVALRLQAKPSNKLSHFNRFLLERFIVSGWGALLV